MPTEDKHELLRQIPSLTELLKEPAVGVWLEQNPRYLVTDCLRRAVDKLRQQVLGDEHGRCGMTHVTPRAILERAGELLAAAVRPHLREAINATGVILHTGLGRAVFPACVVDSMTAELKGCVNLAVDRDSGERIERDELVEYILTELSGAEAATVLNNNAGATLAVLAALAAHKEVIVSRGQLLEIGGSFRLPDVMVQSQARLVEVGTTNRTHLKDYRNAITDQTAAILRVHPSNYRVVGFTSEVSLPDLAELAHGRGLIVIDDLGAGALVDMARFGLPHEPTVRESITAGADVVLFSGDKLIGASQSGVIVGRKDLIERIRKHPLSRALRVDKTCLMVLERTLHLFREPELLLKHHPLYRALSTPLEALQKRAESLAAAISEAAPATVAQVSPSVAYVGSGTLPTEAVRSAMVTVRAPRSSASELSRRLRMDESSVFGRIENDLVCLDVLTVADEQVPAVAAAVGRAAL